MTENTPAAGDGHAGFLTAQDEMSLTDSLAAQTDESQPDTLEVHSDAVAVMQGSMQGLRRPAVIAAVAVGVAVGIVVILGLVGRARRGVIPGPGE
jgi:hypothetical protein